ncbi:MAG: TonB-dependent receptor [Methylococcaceae bacterium]|nr:TonB-dependent receptor [Methylococcaceae bacterium]
MDPVRSPSSVVVHLPVLTDPQPHRTGRPLLHQQLPPSQRSPESDRRPHLPAGTGPPRLPGGRTGVFRVGPSILANPQRLARHDAFLQRLRSPAQLSFRPDLLEQFGQFRSGDRIFQRNPRQDLRCGIDRQVEPLPLVDAGSAIRLSAQRSAPAPPAARQCVRRGGGRSAAAVLLTHRLQPARQRRVGPALALCRPHYRRPALCRLWHCHPRLPEPGCPARLATGSLAGTVGHWPEPAGRRPSGVLSGVVSRRPVGSSAGLLPEGQVAILMRSLPAFRFVLAALAGLGAWSAGLSGLLSATTALAEPAELSDLNLEQLMGMQITSASKKSQKLSDVAAAVHVITQEDIRRSGVTSIPEALRLAPGIQVARIDANKWAISARGFNGRFANKLLVLMDGRSVYTPTFAGVYWEVQDTVLEDIDRIEVIRGPGATVWGANAVNGVINIITKQAGKTRGGEISVGAGSQERAFGSARYGFELSDDTHARVYFKGFDRERFPVRDAADRGSSDAWNMQRGGFRLDHDGKAGERFTLQGDLYTGSLRQSIDLAQLSAPYSLHVHDTANVSGANLLGRWQKALGLGEEVSLQVYYDRNVRNEVFLNETRDTFDIDFQHHLGVGERQDLIWGLGYRYSHDNFSNPTFVQFGNGARGVHLFSGFLQDEISLVPEKLKLTLGTKLEHNDFTGFEIQPSLRLAWTPNSHHALWGAVSRAVRTPSRSDDAANTHLLVLPPLSGVNPTGFPIAVSPVHNKAMNAETLLGFELGYRFIPSSSLSLDTALFYNDYDRLRTISFGPVLLRRSANGLYIDQTLPFSNIESARSYGGEASLVWNPLSNWSLQAQYSYLGLETTFSDRQFANNINLDEISTPQQQWSLRSGWDLPQHLELDLWLRYVDRIQAGIPAPLRINDYLTLDARLGWRPHPSLDLALVGQNLLDGAHPEFIMESGYQQHTVVEVPRAFFLKLNWRF